MENGHRDARELVARVLQKKNLILSARNNRFARSRVWRARSSRTLAQGYAGRAKACLNGHNDSEFARALATLPDFISNARTSSQAPCFRSNWFITNAMI